MDQVIRQHGYWVDWPMQRKPSEHLGLKAFVTGLDDVEGFRQAAVPSREPAPVR